MKYCFEHEIYINEFNETFLVTGSIKTRIDKHYGEDADGNRSRSVIESELDEWKITNELGFEETRKKAIELIEFIYDNKYMEKDIEKAEELQREEA